MHQILFRRGLVRLYCAYVDERMVMGALCTTFGGRVRGIYNGANQRGLEARATTAVIWRLIEECSVQGFSSLSFGMANLDVTEPTSPAHGLHRFKMDLGAQLRRVPVARKELRPVAIRAHRALKHFKSSLRRILGGGE
jgi:lipid II:glycine glycyltransferase (peptidoglycan interpeptide bridge formation enzyme)